MSSVKFLRHHRAGFGVETAIGQGSIVIAGKVYHRHMRLILDKLGQISTGLRRRGCHQTAIGPGRRRRETGKQQQQQSVYACELPFLLLFYPIRDYSQLPSISTLAIAPPWLIYPAGPIALTAKTQAGEPPVKSRLSRQPGKSIPFA